MIEPEGIEVLAEASAWQSLGITEIARTAIAATLADAGLHPEKVGIAVLACDDPRIAALNGSFRNKPMPTNVLAWPAQDLAAAKAGGSPRAPAGPELGDIAIAWETCAREAAEAGKPVVDHATHLLVHATLHLLGYRHDTRRDAAVMEQREAHILARLGLPDPYQTEPQVADRH